MEVPAGLTDPAPWRAPGYRVALASVLAMLVAVPLGIAAPESPRSPAAARPPGFLWGRLAVEEESPEGPWMPLSGITVALYPHAATVLADLERIRDQARGSGPDYDAAVGRLQDRLRGYEVELGGQGPPPAPAPERSGWRLFGDRPAAERRAESRSPAGPVPGDRPSGVPVPGDRSPGGPAASGGAGAPPAGAGPVATPQTGAGPVATPPPGAGPVATPSPASPVRRTVTDRHGLFLFPDLPAGEWLLVAIQITDYRAVRSESGQPGGRRPLGRGGGGAFLPRTVTPAREAEVWVAPVRVTPGERTRLFLTDRGRFLVGPIRDQPAPTP
jgi:hypothetical protein